MLRPRFPGTAIEQAIKQDDFARVGELIGDWAFIDEPVEVAGGRYSPLFLAVREGAIGTTTYLLAMGANPDLEFDGVTCRALAVRPLSRKCLDLFFRAGLSPRAVELLACAGDGVPSIVPETNVDSEFRMFLSDLKGIFEFRSSFEHGAICRAIEKGQAFKALTAEAREAIATGKRNLLKNPGAKSSVKQRMHQLIVIAHPPHLTG